jgi:hypothetical protein
LRVTEIRVRPSKRDPSKASLSVHGVLADAGWEGANPRRSGVNLGLVAAAPPACCTIAEQFWMEPRPRRFKFWDMHRSGRVCPPVGDMRVGVSGPGRAVFKLFAPRIDLPTEIALDTALQVVIGNHCSVGTLPFKALQQRGRALVYP